MHCKGRGKTIKLLHSMDSGWCSKMVRPSWVGSSNGDMEEWLADSWRALNKWMCIKFVHFYKFIWCDAFIIWLKWDCDYEDWWYLENKVLSLSHCNCRHLSSLYCGNAFAQCKMWDGKNLPPNVLVHCILFNIHISCFRIMCAGCCSRSFFTHHFIH